MQTMEGRSSSWLNNTAFLSLHSPTPNFRFLPGQGTQLQHSRSSGACLSSASSTSRESHFLKAVNESASFASVILVAMAARFIRQKRIRHQQRRCRKVGRLESEAAKFAVDDAGRFWETPVSRIGPPMGRNSGTSLLSRWQNGNGHLRTLCYQADAVTTLALNAETICLGTRCGSVKTMDIESGALVGEYCQASHLPPAEITTIYFDGSAVIAGDAAGGLRAWRAELPGSWGVAHSPDWVMKIDDIGQAHTSGVTGLALTSDGVLASSGADGAVIFWRSFSNESKEVGPSKSVSVSQDENVVLSLCSAGEEYPGEVYAGTSDGAIFRVSTDGAAKQIVDPDLIRRNAVTALALDSASGSLIIGRDNGVIQSLSAADDAAECVNLDNFHGGSAIKHLEVKPGSAGSRSLLISTAGDGVVGVWDMSTRKPLWGLCSLSPRNLVACADKTRLITNGLVVNVGAMGNNSVLLESWKDKFPPTKWKAPSCEALLCFDMLPAQGAF
eukprot:TRINITY_DN14331_c2_g1_i1.p1 TRINITY_DN14331_c2_g1~~TRINITY_DN14331_c2_g1_i1.p1  ORF type:complete len:500 (+),score=73.02 TRINITY_DN14331_c2_g1_i1:41-1540(+)